MHMSIGKLPLVIVAMHGIEIYLSDILTPQRWEPCSTSCSPPRTVTRAAAATGTATRRRTTDTATPTPTADRYARRVPVFRMWATWWPTSWALEAHLSPVMQRRGFRPWPTPGPTLLGILPTTLSTEPRHHLKSKDKGNLSNIQWHSQSNPLTYLSMFTIFSFLSVSDKLKTAPTKRIGSQGDSWDERRHWGRWWCYRTEQLQKMKLQKRRKMLKTTNQWLTKEQKQQNDKHKWLLKSL